MAEKSPESLRKTTSAEKDKTQSLGMQAKTVTPISQRSIAARKESLAVNQFEAGTRKEDIEDQVRHRAYELFEERGRREGFDQEDWARAEAEVLFRYQRGKSA